MDRPAGVRPHSVERRDVDRKSEPVAEEKSGGGRKRRRTPRSVARPNAAAAPIAEVSMSLAVEASPPGVAAAVSSVGSAPVAASAPARAGADRWLRAGVLVSAVASLAALLLVLLADGESTTRRLFGTWSRVTDHAGARGAASNESPRPPSPAGHAALPSSAAASAAVRTAGTVADDGAAPKRADAVRPVSAVTDGIGVIQRPVPERVAAGHPVSAGTVELGRELGQPPLFLAPLVDASGEMPVPTLRRLRRYNIVGSSLARRIGLNDDDAGFLAGRFVHHLTRVLREASGADLDEPNRLRLSAAILRDTLADVRRNLGDAAARLVERELERLERAD